MSGPEVPKNIMNFKKNLARIATVSMVVTQLVGFSAVNAAETAVDVMSKAGSTAVQTINTAGVLHTVTVTGFADGAATIASADWTMADTAVTIASGSFTFTATNPATPGSYLFTVTQGATSVGWSVPILNQDWITVSATVDPSISFDITAQDTGSSCGTGFSNGAYTSHDYAIDFGHLNSSRRIAWSEQTNATVQQHICTLLSTNATSGAVVTIKNANGADGLKSVSVPADKIPSATAAINSTTPNYGIYGHTDYLGAASVTPASAIPTNSLSATALTTAQPASVVGLTTTPQNVWTVAGVTSDAYYTLGLAVGVSATQPAHNDYTDTVTLVATATF